VKFWQQPIVVATYRALVGAVIAGGAAYFVATSQGGSGKVALAAAGAAFFSYLATRAAAEGVIDQARASGGS
jgi:hypothetical protein